MLQLMYNAPFITEHKQLSFIYELVMLSKYSLSQVLNQWYLRLWGNIYCNTSCFIKKFRLVPTYSYQLIAVNRTGVKHKYAQFVWSGFSMDTNLEVLVILWYMLCFNWLICTKHENEKRKNLPVPKQMVYILRVYTTERRSFAN